jgi:hypothetical protein
MTPVTPTCRSRPLRESEPVKSRPPHWWHRWSQRRGDLSPGERVRITAWSGRGLEGTLDRRARLPNGKAASLVILDRRVPIASRGRMRVAEWCLERLPPT